MDNSIDHILAQIRSADAKVDMLDSPTATDMFESHRAAYLAGRQYGFERFMQWCNECPKAHNFTCSGADAKKCEQEKQKLLTKRQQHIDADNTNTSSETVNRDAVQQPQRVYKPNGFDVVDAFMHLIWGRKVRQLTWAKNEYIELVDCGLQIGEKWIIRNDGRLYPAERLFDKDSIEAKWEDYEEGNS